MKIEISSDRRLVRIKIDEIVKVVPIGVWSYALANPSVFSPLVLTSATAPIELKADYVPN